MGESSAMFTNARWTSTVEHADIHRLKCGLETARGARTDNEERVPSDLRCHVCKSDVAPIALENPTHSGKT